MSADDFDPKEYPLLADLGDEDRDALVELLEGQKIARGRKLFREGSEAEGLVLIETGRVEVSSKRTGATAELGPGAALGALSLVAPGPREMTVQTTEPCRIWKLPRESWRRLAEDAPRTACRIAEAILAETAAQLRDALEAIDPDA